MTSWEDATWNDPIVIALYSYYLAESSDNFAKLEEEVTKYDVPERFGYFNSAAINMVVIHCDKISIEWTMLVRQKMIDSGRIVVPEFMKNKEDVNTLKTKILALVK